MDMGRPPLTAEQVRAKVITYCERYGVLSGSRGPPAVSLRQARDAPAPRVAHGLPRAAATGGTSRRRHPARRLVRRRRRQLSALHPHRAAPKRPSPSPGPAVADASGSCTPAAPTSSAGPRALAPTPSRGSASCSGHATAAPAPDRLSPTPDRRPFRHPRRATAFDERQRRDRVDGGHRRVAVVLHVPRHHGSQPATSAATAHIASSKSRIPRPRARAGGRSHLRPPVNTHEQVRRRPAAPWPVSRSGLQRGAMVGARERPRARPKRRSSPGTRPRDQHPRQRTPRLRSSRATSAATSRRGIRSTSSKSLTRCCLSRSPRQSSSTSTTAITSRPATVPASARAGPRMSSNSASTPTPSLRRPKARSTGCTPGVPRRSRAPSRPPLEHHRRARPQAQLLAELSPGS